MDRQLGRGWCCSVVWEGASGSGMRGKPVALLVVGWSEQINSRTLSFHRYMRIILLAGAMQSTSFCDEHVCETNWVSGFVV